MDCNSWKELLKSKSFVFCFMHPSQIVPDVCVPVILLCVTWKDQSSVVIQHLFVAHIIGVHGQRLLECGPHGVTRRCTPTVDCALKSFPLLNVCLSVSCHRNLFQRKKRSVSMKKKRTRKSLSKTKAKPLKFLAAKKSPAKKFAAKKKRQMHGYQATAPARPRGNFRVNVQVKKRPNPIKIFQPGIWEGRSVMVEWALPNLFSVDVAESVARTP